MGIGAGGDLHGTMGTWFTMMTMQLRDADTMMHVRDCDFFPVDKPQHRSHGGTAGSHTLNRGLPVMERAERRSFGGQRLRHEAKTAKGATRLPDSGGYYSLQLTHNSLITGITNYPCSFHIYLAFQLCLIYQFCFGSEEKPGLSPAPS